MTLSSLSNCLTVNTARRISRKPTRCSTSIIRLTLALVAISYFFVNIDAGRTGLPRCPLDRWGTDCKECPCKNNAKCSPHTGTCTCTPGWKGQYCDKPCDQGYYGNQCRYECSCYNGASCDSVTGTCMCSDGYQGDNCSTTCPEGTHGFKCQKNCTCPINTVCSPIHGSCSCKYEYTYNGTHCECRPKNSIPGCEACNCSQWGTCDLTTGDCMCQQEGYTGQSCRKLHCGDKKYVPGCQGNCQCQYNATCYEIDGSCDCLPGWTGKSCNDSCPDGRYGNSCQSKCTCENRKSCDHVTGKCICLPGWTGENCSTVCPDGNYGNSCQSKCRCENSKSCDPVTGKCICLPGWTGKNCSNRCPDGNYGNNCQSKCTCENSKSCDSVTGRCIDVLTTFASVRSKISFLVVVVLPIFLVILVV